MQTLVHKVVVRFPQGLEVAVPFNEASEEARRE
jgi:hypothetical protein